MPCGHTDWRQLGDSNSQLLSCAGAGAFLVRLARRGHGRRTRAHALHARLDYAATRQRPGMPSAHGALAGLHPPWQLVSDPDVLLNALE